MCVIHENPSCVTFQQKALCVYRVGCIKCESNDVTIAQAVTLSSSIHRKDFDPALVKSRKKRNNLVLFHFPIV